MARTYIHDDDLLSAAEDGGMRRVRTGRGDISYQLQRSKRAHSEREEGSLAPLIRRTMNSC